MSTHRVELTAAQLADLAQLEAQAEQLKAMKLMGLRLILLGCLPEPVVSAAIQASAIRLEGQTLVVEVPGGPALVVEDEAVGNAT
jgi:hypothetical protein